MTNSPDTRPITALLVALPETTGSALYGMNDVLSATSTQWRTFIGQLPGNPLFETKFVSVTSGIFYLENRTPVVPDAAVAENPSGDLIVIPELWIAPDDDMRERYPALVDWLRRRHRDGCMIYSACSGAILLAAAGLLDRRDATSHWGYDDLFRTKFPDVRFNPSASLVVGDDERRIVTAGGATSWHDLVLYIITHHCGRDEAVRIAKTYLLKPHNEGQLPFTALVRRRSHSDFPVQQTEEWLCENFQTANVVAQSVVRSGIPERSFKRRFKKATGSTLIDYVQNLRIEEAKRLLEEGTTPIDEISYIVGYENTSFFRKLFKRLTALTPSEYRVFFKPVAAIADAAAE